MRLIDATELQRRIHEHDYVLHDQNNTVEKGMFTAGIDYAIQTAPTVDVRTAVRGRWEEVRVDRIVDIDYPPDVIAAMFCCVCKHWHNEVYFYGNPTEFAHFCPYCGADMREED